MTKPPAKQPPEQKVSVETDGKTIRFPIPSLTVAKNPNQQTEEWRKSTIWGREVD